MESSRKPFETNAWKTLEIPIEAAVPCKLRTTKRPSKVLETDSDTRGSNNNIPKTKHVYIVEGHESARKRLEFTLPKDHEDHIVEKGFNSLSQWTKNGRSSRSCRQSILLR